MTLQQLLITDMKALPICRIIGFAKWAHCPMFSPWKCDSNDQNHNTQSNGCTAPIEVLDLACSAKHKTGRTQCDCTLLFIDLNMEG